MLFWPIAVLISVLTLAVMIVSVRKERLDVEGSLDTDTTAREQYFRSRLSEINQDGVLGKLDAEQAEIAKAELAQEVLSFRAQSPEGSEGAKQNSSQAKLLIWTGIFIPVFAIAVYALIGQPSLPSQPLATRPAGQITFEDAIFQIEDQMRLDPSDIRGWQALGPAYMRAQRFDDAVIAFQHILDLAPVSADGLSDLAEAKLMQNNGVLSIEAAGLLARASQLDATHIRSRFYLAGEATRTQDWDNAERLWAELLDLAGGDEPWIANAQNGLAFSQARGAPEPQELDESENSGNQAEMIAGMVEGLDQRLFDVGGTIEEWTRLVRSRLVLEQSALAQRAYDAAVSAYPLSQGRLELDALAQGGGLETTRD